MKIWIHRYRLQPGDSKAPPRQGALVKVEWAVGQIGFSDLHPWTEFGEPPLEEHIRSLAEVRFTKLADNSLEFNYADREFRLAKRNAFTGLILPRSHRLVTNIHSLESRQLSEWHKAGFTHLKVKMGNDLETETTQLLSLAFAAPLLWRIDLNGKVDAERFTRWWSALGDDVKARIDFVEDPTNGEALKYDGPWANDWKNQPRAQIRVLKPAREPLGDLALYDRVIFTHSMDHPLGQACAAWTASRFHADHPKKLEVCGLLSSGLYEPEEFSREWSNEGPRMKATGGTGFGFDELLEGLKWEKIL